MIPKGDSEGGFRRNGHALTLLSSVYPLHIQQPRRGTVGDDDVFGATHVVTRALEAEAVPVFCWAQKSRAGMILPSQEVHPCHFPLHTERLYSTIQVEVSRRERGFRWKHRGYHFMGIELRSHPAIVNAHFALSVTVSF